MRRALLAFEPPDGGVAEHVYHLAAGLPAHGWEVVVAGPPRSTIYERLEAAGIRVHRLADLRRGFSRPDRDKRALAALRQLLREQRFDLVHCHSSKAGLLGRLAARRCGVPAIYTPHAFGFIGEVGSARRALVPLVERALGRSTRALICVCDAELELAREHRIGTAATRHRIYHGVEPCAGADGVPAGLERAPGELLVAAIAVFRRQKRLDLLIEATPRILAAVPAATVAIVGDGPLRAQLREQARALGLLDHPRFRFLDFSPPSHRYVRALDLFALPSAWEAFPISLLEALACGVPQVATDVGGSGEAVTADTGVLIPPGDAGRLAGAVIGLLEDRRRRETMAIASKQRFEERFRLERMVAETEQVYREVAARDRASDNR